MCNANVTQASQPMWAQVSLHARLHQQQTRWRLQTVVNWLERPIMRTLLSSMVSTQDEYVRNTRAWATYASQNVPLCSSMGTYAATR